MLEFEVATRWAEFFDSGRKMVYLFRNKQKTDVFLAFVYEYDGEGGCKLYHGTAEAMRISDLHAEAERGDDPAGIMIDIVNAANTVVLDTMDIDTSTTTISLNSEVEALGDIEWERLEVKDYTFKLSFDKGTLQLTSR